MERDGARGGQGSRATSASWKAIGGCDPPHAERCALLAAEFATLGDVLRQRAELRRKRELLRHRLKLANKEHAVPPPSSTPMVFAS